MFKTLSFYFS